MKDNNPEREFSEKDESAIRQIISCHTLFSSSGSDQHDRIEIAKHAIKYGRMQGAAKERTRIDFGHPCANRTFLYEALLHGKKLRDEATTKEDKGAAADRLARLTGQSQRINPPITNNDCSIAIGELHSTAEILNFYNTRQSFSVYHQDQRAAAIKFFNRAIMRCVALNIDTEKILDELALNLVLETK